MFVNVNCGVRKKASGLSGPVSSFGGDKTISSNCVGPKGSVGPAEPPSVKVGRFNQLISNIASGICPLLLRVKVRSYTLFASFGMEKVVKL